MASGITGGRKVPKVEVQGGGEDTDGGTGLVTKFGSIKPHFDMIQPDEKNRAYADIGAAGNWQRVIQKHQCE